MRIDLFAARADTVDDVDWNRVIEELLRFDNAAQIFTRVMRKGKK